MERELSFYGDEETGVLLQRLYDREDAVAYLKAASYVLDQCAALLEGRKRKRTACGPLTADLLYTRCAHS